jgi:hypothetical protein
MIRPLCVICHVNPARTRAGSLYCSEDCHAAATLARWRRLHPPQMIEPRPCATCGTEFTPGRGRDEARYCKTACRVAAHRARKRTDAGTTVPMPPELWNRLDAPAPSADR